jgi:hypothetical protein
MIIYIFSISLKLRILFDILLLSDDRKFNTHTITDIAKNGKKNFKTSIFLFEICCRLELAIEYNTFVQYF